MKIYTQEEFNNMPIVNGRKACPTGDYSNIKVFGKSCSFGESCSFENHIGQGHEILQIKAGSAGRTSTAYNLNTGIYVRSGCWLGTLNAFKEMVVAKHKDNKHAKAYLLLSQIIELYFIGEPDCKCLEKER